MSTSFIYGGIERDCLVWSGQCEFSKDHSLSRRPDRTTDFSERSGLASRDGFVHGGIDRSSVNWLDVGRSPAI